MTEEKLWEMPPEIHLCQALAHLWKAKNHLSFTDQRLTQVVNEAYDAVLEHSKTLLAWRTRGSQ